MRSALPFNMGRANVRIFRMKKAVAVQNIPASNSPGKKRRVRTGISTALSVRPGLFRQQLFSRRLVPFLQTGHFQLPGPFQQRAFFQ